MKRVIAAAAVLLLGAACRDSALASGEKRIEATALCAADHRVPRVLLDYHHERISRFVALSRLRRIRHTIAANATGRYEAHLRDLAAAIYVFERVTTDRGDSGDAYRDLRVLRESLPSCPKGS